MLSLRSALQLRVFASSEGQLVYRRVQNRSRPWQLLTFPPSITTETVDCLAAAARICPHAVELVVVVPGIRAMLHPAVQHCEGVVFVADPLSRLHRALAVHQARSHVESFLLNADGLVQFTLVHRLPGPALRTMAQLLNVLLQETVSADNGTPEFKAMTVSDSPCHPNLDRLAANVPT